MKYEERFYRLFCKKEFSFEISYKETDLFISTDKALDKEEVRKIVKNYYEAIASYIKINPSFFASLVPIDIDEQAPPIVKDMVSSSSKAGVGPFSAVAGAISWYVGNNLTKICSEVIVENGGDLFLKVNEDKKIGLYLGKNFSPSFITIKLKKKDKPFGIASSSSKIGHSLNFGDADLVTIVASDSILADAFATAFSNQIKKERDIHRILREARKLPFLWGIVVAFKKKLFFWGEVTLDL